MARRLLIISWCIYAAGVALLLVFPGHFVRQWTLVALLALGLTLIVTSTAYAFVLAGTQILTRFKSGGRWAANITERCLIGGWITCVITLLTALFFPNAKWVPGPEVLLALFAVVVLSSLAYAAYLLLRRFMGHLEQ